jgi:hypothetical protein
VRRHIPLAFSLSQFFLFLAFSCSSYDPANVPVREMIGLGRVALADQNWSDALDLANRVMKIDAGPIPAGTD